MEYNSYVSKWKPTVCVNFIFKVHKTFTRVSEVIMFSPCVFVCLSRCLSGRFNYEGLVPHKHYFPGTLLGMSSCASYVSRTHDVIDDVTRSQSRSNFESDISPSIFELERWSKAQNVGNAHGYLGLMVYSTSGITSGKKVCREFKMAANLKILKYLTQLQFDLRYEKIVPNYAKKKYFHDDDVIDDVTGWLQIRPSIFLYKWNNNIYHDN